MNGRLGESRLAFCSDSTKPQMIGKMLNRATRNTAGRTKAHPARLSECQMRCARLGGRGGEPAIVDTRYPPASAVFTCCAASSSAAWGSACPSITLTTAAPMIVLICS